MAEYQNSDQRSFRFLLPAVLLTCGSILIFLGLDTRDLRSWLHQAGSWAPLAFIVVAVAAMTVLVPKTVVSVTAGALFGTALGSLLMLVVAVLAAGSNYAIGRWWLHDTVNQHLLAAGPRDRAMWLRAVRDLAAEAGFRVHLLVRLSPIPTTLISYAMGASGSKLRPFLLASAVAVGPQTLWVHGGTAASLIDDPAAGGLQWTGVVVSLVSAIALSAVIPRLALKRVETIRQLQSG